MLEHVVAWPLWPGSPTLFMIIGEPGKLTPTSLKIPPQLIEILLQDQKCWNMLTPTSLKISPSVSNSPESLFFLSHFLNDWNFLEIEKSRPTKVLALKAQLGHTRNN